nr:DUF6265 family protein [Pedobacter panaciterrae]
MKIKKLLFLIPAILLVTVIYSVNGQSNPQKFKDLEWLVGKWTRVNAKAGESGYETWTRISPVKLSGKGVTLKGEKPIFVENLEFKIKGNDIFYVVMVTGEKQPTYFKLTELNKDGFTCENPEHDFPKKISYKKTGNNVKATISGNGQSVDYNFVPALK